jgi:hypothetical protein
MADDIDPAIPVFEQSNLASISSLTPEAGGNALAVAVTKGSIILFAINNVEAVKGDLLLRSGH